MTPESYWNLDLCPIHIDAGRYQVRASDSQGREEISDLDLSVLDDVEIPTGSAATPMACQQLGRRLFAAIFQGELLALLRLSRREAQSNGQGLRLRFHFLRAPQLARLPWELLYDPTENRFPALSDWTPIVRYLEHSDPIRPLSGEPPLRILVVLASPEDFQALDIEREWQRLQDALSQPIERSHVELERLESPTLDGLRERLEAQTYHVLHFVGHGSFLPTQDEGLLVFEDVEGLGHGVLGETLGVLLHDVSDSLRLVFLNACETARSHLDRPFGGVGQQLVRQGVPAVVALRSAIEDPSAIMLSSELYRALARGLPIDTSLGRARRALRTAGNWEWATPTLYLRSQDSRLLRSLPLADATYPTPDSSSQARRWEEVWAQPEETLPEGPSLARNRSPSHPALVLPDGEQQGLDDYWRLADFAPRLSVRSLGRDCEAQTVLRLVGGSVLLDIAVSNLGDRLWVLDTLSCQTRSRPFDPLLGPGGRPAEISGIYSLSIHIADRTVTQALEPRLVIDGHGVVRFLVLIDFDTRGCAFNTFRFALRLAGTREHEVFLGPFVLERRTLSSSFEETFRELRRRHREHPEDLPTLSRFAQMSRAKYGVADDLFRKILALDPRNTEALRALRRGSPDGEPPESEPSSGPNR